MRRLTGAPPYRTRSYNLCGTARGLRCSSFHARVHASRYRELIAMKPLAHEEPPEPVTVECPRCGDLYVAELQPYEDYPDLEEMEWEAGRRLRRSARTICISSMCN
jgi:hypothetical protein